VSANEVNKPYPIAEDATYKEKKVHADLIDVDPKKKAPLMSTQEARDFNKLKDAIEGMKSQEARHDSPFVVQDVDKSWPLVLPNLNEEITTPDNPIHTDVFESMFVSSLPASPEEHLSTSRHKSQDSGRSKSKKTTVPTFEDFMLGNSYDKIRDDVLIPASPTETESGRQRSGSRRHLDVITGLPMVTTPTSLTSDVSTPEIKDASAAGYFKAVQVTTPTALSPNETRPLSRTWSSGREQVRSPRLFLNDDEKLDTVADVKEEDTATKKRYPIAQRASVASLEHFDRSQVSSRLVHYCKV